MIISLGSTSRVKDSLQQILQINNNNLFDYIICNFESILYIIKNIDKQINNSDFVDIKFISEINENIDILNEKRIKLKNDIINSSHIDFIHLVDNTTNNNNFRPTNIYLPSNWMIGNFVYFIKKINPNLSFTLHLLIPPNYIDENRQIIDSLYHPYLKIHCLNSEWNWTLVYNNLTHIIPKILSNGLPSDFDPYIYIKLHNDLSDMSNEDASSHYIIHGMNEGRQYKVEDYLQFNANIYKSFNIDLQCFTDKDATIHFIKFGKNENRRYK